MPLDMVHIHIRDRPVGPGGQYFRVQAGSGGHRVGRCERPFQQVFVVLQWVAIVDGHTLSYLLERSKSAFLRPATGPIRLVTSRAPASAATDRKHSSIAPSSIPWSVRSRIQTASRMASRVRV